MAIWLARSGKHCEHESRFLKDDRIYLTWWGLKTDLSGLKDRQELLTLLEAFYPQAKEAKRRQNSAQIWSFSHRMAVGDWVCVPSKRKTIHIGEITGAYQFDLTAEDPYFHYRNVKWLQLDVPRTNFDQDILYSLGAFSTICRVQRNDAENRIRAMKGNGWKSSGVRPLQQSSNEDDDSDENPVAEFDLEQVARDQIARTIYSHFKGHGLETLVEAILRAKGFTTHHTDKGADGGIDILAAPDTLGFGHPRICVQVKSQAAPVERVVLDQLVGAMQHVGADQGLLVSWGGFKSTIKREVPRLFFKVRLWDQNDVIDEFLLNYDRLDEDLKAEIPLKRIWAMAASDDRESEA